MKFCWNTAFVILILPVCHALVRNTGFSGSSNTHSSANPKTFVLAIEATTQNAAAINNLATNADFLDDIDQTWFHRYIIVAFDATGVTLSIVTKSSTEVYALLSLISHSLSANNNCTLPLFSVVMNNQIADFVEPQSIVYVITTAVSSWSDEDIFELTNLSIQVQYIVVTSTACSNDSTFGMDSIFASDVTANNGNAFKIDPQEVVRFLGAHLPTLYNNKFIQNPVGNYECYGMFFEIAVDAGVKIVYLYTFSSSSPVVTRGNSSYSLNILFNDGYSNIFSFNPDVPANYRIALDAPDFCLLQIRFQYELETPTSPYYNVQADILLMLDISGDVSTTQIADFKLFFMNSLPQFNIGWSNNLYIGIITVKGDDSYQGADLAYFLGGFSDAKDFENSLEWVYQQTSTGGGQLALKDHDHGYRVNINNHLIIYATTNATADTAAVSAAASVISSGKYSVAAVAYGANGSNTQSLTSLVGGKAGCVITANDANGLTTTAANALVTLIWNAANNNGAYCT